ncbi:complex I assembly factor TIMMDC1, mitochondrial [Biomphalaria glabrata]|nr:complex I assembly factor TIMMDC1, mitochondrial [Biomphalaria glabrata]
MSFSMLSTFINFKNNSKLKSFVLPTAFCSSQDSVENNMQLNDLPGFKANLNSSKKHVYSEVGLTTITQNETGWDRLKMLYCYRYQTGFIQEDVQMMNTIIKRVVFLGAIISLVSASSRSSAKLLEKQSPELPTMKVLLLERSIRRDILKETVKTTLKMAAFSCIIIHLSQAIAAYRNKSTVWEYGIASSLAFAFKELDQGMRIVVRAGAMGAIMGIIGGYVICSALSTSGWSQEERNLPRRLKYMSLQDGHSVKLSTSEFTRD